MMKLQRGFPDFDLDGKEIYLDRVRGIFFLFGSQERETVLLSFFSLTVSLSTSSSLLPLFLPLFPQFQLDGLAERMRIFVTRMRLSGDAQAKEWLHLVRKGKEVFDFF